MKVDPKLLAKHIVGFATDFVGMVEVESNAKWDDPRTKWTDVDKDVWLRSRMAHVTGWKKKLPYCAAFDGAIVCAMLERQGVNPADIKARFLSWWTAHCMTNARSAKAKGILTMKPVPGALWLAQHGTSESGHAGIVASVNDLYMTTIEGNTSAGVNGSQRQGDGIYLRTRSLITNGLLVTRGFVSPASIAGLFG